MFFIRDPDQIVREAITRFQQGTGFTQFAPGSSARALVEAVGNQTQKAYGIFELGFLESFVGSSSGSHLDFIGELLGISRKTKSKATVDKGAKNFRFYTNAPNFGSINNGQDIGPIPIGTLIETEPQMTGERAIQVVVTEETILPAYENSHYISVESLAFGSEAKAGELSFNKHNFDRYADAVNQTLLVTNVSSVDTGTDDEGDDAYRFRLINQALRGEAANETAIRLAALLVPVVADVSIFSRWRGIGTADVIILSTAGRVSPTLVAAVQDQINPVAGSGCHVLARAPSEVGLSSWVDVVFKSGVIETEKRDLVREMLRRYREYFADFLLGQDLVFADQYKILYFDDRIKQIGEPNKPIKRSFIYKSDKDGNRVRERLIGDLFVNPDEKILPEFSITSPLIVSVS